MADLNFPYPASDGDSYSLNGVKYVYSQSANAWLTTLLLRPLDTGNTSNTQIVFNDKGVANGSHGLTFDRQSNTFTTNTAIVSGNVTASYYIGDGSALANINLSSIYSLTNIVFNTVNNTTNSATSLAASLVISNSALMYQIYENSNTFAKIVTKLIFDIANTSGNTANYAGIVANSSYDFSNSAGITANYAGVVANSSYDFANSAGITANYAGVVANTSGNTANYAATTANIAYDGANVFGDIANTAGITANIAAQVANNAANTANGYVSNSSNIIADLILGNNFFLGIINATSNTAVNSYMDTRITPIFSRANASWTYVSAGGNTLVSTASANTLTITNTNGITVSSNVENNWIQISLDSTYISDNGSFYFPNGNVGIGKNNAQYELDVNGTINATAMLLNGKPPGISIAKTYFLSSS